MNMTKGGEKGNFPIPKLDLVYKTIKTITKAKTADEVLISLMDETAKVLLPEIAAFLLRDSATHDLKYCLIQGPLDEPLKGKIVHRGEGLVGLAAETNQDLFIADCHEDPRFNPEIDRLENLEFRSVMAVPFRIESKVFGVVYLINKKDGPSFKVEDFQLLTTLVNQAELSIERLVLWKKLDDLEEIDLATGVYNPQGFFKYFQKEIKRSERYRLDLSILETRIDYYEKILETFGQEAGDRVVANLSYILKKTARDVDLVGRLEDDLFLVLLPQTNRSGASRLRERIIKILDHQNLRSTGIPYTVTINVYYEAGENAANLYKLPIVLNWFNHQNRQSRPGRPLLPGEELVEIIMSSLFLVKK